MHPEHPRLPTSQSSHNFVQKSLIINALSANKRCPKYPNLLLILTGFLFFTHLMRVITDKEEKLQMRLKLISKRNIMRRRVFIFHLSLVFSKTNLHSSNRFIISRRFNEDCNFSNCNYREHQTHFHCMRKDCNYRFCDKTRFVQHTARHERLDTLCGDEFQGFRGVACGREDCELNVLHNSSRLMQG